MEKLTRFLVFNDEIFMIVSSNPRRLYQQYCSMLKQNKHPNEAMQKAYNKYGKPRLVKPQGE